MKDKRLVDRLTEHWERLKGDDLYPQYDKLRTDAIMDIWERCIVLDVEKQTGKGSPLYTYQHMGREVVKAYGSDLTGHYVNVHMHNFPGWQVLKSVDDIFKEPVVQTSAGSFVNDTDQVVKYRACVMPFGQNDVITNILVGLSWKAF